MCIRSLSLSPCHMGAQEGRGKPGKGPSQEPAHAGTLNLHFQLLERWESVLSQPLGLNAELRQLRPPPLPGPLCGLCCQLHGVEFERSPSMMQPLTCTQCNSDPAAPFAVVRGI